MCCSGKRNNTGVAGTARVPTRVNEKLAPTPPNAPYLSAVNAAHPRYKRGGQCDERQRYAKRVVPLQNNQSHVRRSAPVLASPGYAGRSQHDINYTPAICGLNSPLQDLLANRSEPFAGNTNHDEKDQPCRIPTHQLGLPACNITLELGWRMLPSRRPGISLIRAIRAPRT